MATGMRRDTRLCSSHSSSPAVGRNMHTSFVFIYFFTLYTSSSTNIPTTVTLKLLNIESLTAKLRSGVQPLPFSPLLYQRLVIITSGNSLFTSANHAIDGMLCTSTYLRRRRHRLRRLVGTALDAVNTGGIGAWYRQLFDEYEYSI